MEKNFSARLIYSRTYHRTTQRAKYCHPPLHGVAHAGSEVKESARNAEPESARADSHTHDAKSPGPSRCTAFMVLGCRWP